MYPAIKFWGTLDWGLSLYFVHSGLHSVSPSLCGSTKLDKKQSCLFEKCFSKQSSSKETKLKQ